MAANSIIPLLSKAHSRAQKAGQRPGDIWVEFAGTGMYHLGPPPLRVAAGYWQLLLAEDGERDLDLQPMPTVRLCPHTGGRPYTPSCLTCSQGYDYYGRQTHGRLYVVMYDGTNIALVGDVAIGVIAA